MPLPRSFVHAMRTWVALWRIRVLHELHYRANLVLNVVQVVVDLAIGLVAIRLVFSSVDALNGWSEPELLVVLGTYTTLDAFIRALVLPNMWMLMQDVQEGTFDAVLLMPADEQLIVTARELSIWDLSGVVIGGCVTTYGHAGSTVFTPRTSLRTSRCCPLPSRSSTGSSSPSPRSRSD